MSFSYAAFSDFRSSSAELLEDEESARRAAIEELSGLDLDAPAPREREDARRGGGQRGKLTREGRRQLGEASPPQVLRARPEHPCRARVPRARRASRNRASRRRTARRPGLQSRKYWRSSCRIRSIPQDLGHPVVHVDELVEIRLARAVQARSEVAFPPGTTPRGSRSPPARGGRGRESHPCREGRGERRLHGEEPGPVVPEQVRREGHEREVNEGQVDDEPPAQRRDGSQTAIPYFSNRR